MSMLGRTIVLLTCLTVAHQAAVFAGTPVGTTMTYQGQLKEAGVPLNGTVDLQFELFDADVDGIPIGSPLLIEDVPGVGKTMLARTLARSTGCTFKRIQFTPDLLPSDVTGVSVYNQKTGDFEFRAGPLHSQIVLADEINRATPKAQSSMLEAMEER